MKFNQTNCSHCFAVEEIQATCLLAAQMPAYRPAVLGGSTVLWDPLRPLQLIITSSPTCALMSTIGPTRSNGAAEKSETWEEVERSGTWKQNTSCSGTSAQAFTDPNWPGVLANLSLAE